jgi:exosortase A
MAAIWWNSSTYTHCALILPIIGWLVWQRLPELRQLRPAAWWPPLLLVAAGGLIWLLGDAGSVGLARHLALVLMLQGAVMTCLGKSVARGLAFPIFYAFFLIPVGDEIVPTMQTITAAMCMALLDLVGIPAHIEGIFITTPDGYFEVAEACAGVKFLVAMVAYGALVANVCFRSWPRRLLFMLAAIAIPILANGIRAWGTIYISSVTDTNFAAGFDHVVYGWVFFAIVIALLMGAGWPFFDRKPGDPLVRPRAFSGPPPAHPPLVRADALPRCRWLVPAIAVAATRRRAAASPAGLPGWTRSQPTRRPPWHRTSRADLSHRPLPRRARAGRSISPSPSSPASRRARADRFRPGRDRPESDWAWTRPAPRRGSSTGSPTTGSSAKWHLLPGRAILTGREVEAKIEATRVRLLGGPQRAVAVLVSAEAPSEGESPRPAIDAFLGALGDVAVLADRAAGLPETG